MVGSLQCLKLRLTKRRLESPTGPHVAHNAEKLLDRLKIELGSAGTGKLGERRSWESKMPARKEVDGADSMRKSTSTQEEEAGVVPGPRNSHGLG